MYNHSEWSEEKDGIQESRSVLHPSGSKVWTFWEKSKLNSDYLNTQTNLIHRISK